MDHSTQSVPGRAIPVTPADAWKYCALTGALGIASGFTLFGYLWYAGEHAHPAQLVIGLLIAAGMSFVFEWLRELVPQAIEESESHPVSHHRSWSSWLITVVMLFVFELFVVSWHNLPEMHSFQFQQLASAISGMPDAPPWLSLGSLIVVWVVVGAALSVALSQQIGRSPRGNLESTTEAMVHGGICGLLIPPAAVLVVVLLVRMLLAVQMLVFDRERWLAHLDALANVLPSFLKLSLWGIRLLDQGAAYAGPLRPLVVIGGIAVAIWIGLGSSGTGKKEFGPIHWFLIAVAAIVVAPLLLHLNDLFMLLVLAALVWAIPATLLGAMTPLLARPSENRKFWGLTALAAGMLLLGVTALRFGWPPSHSIPLIWGLVALLVAGSVVVFRLRHVEEAWPILSLTMAVLVWNVSVVAQQLTFSGVLARFHVLNSASASVTGSSIFLLPRNSALKPAPSYLSLLHRNENFWRSPLGFGRFSSLEVAKGLDSVRIAPLLEPYSSDSRLKAIEKDFPGVKSDLDRFAGHWNQLQNTEVVAIDNDLDQAIEEAVTDSARLSRTHEELCHDYGGICEAAKRASHADSKGHADKPSQPATTPSHVKITKRKRHRSAGRPARAVHGEHSSYNTLLVELKGLKDRIGVVRPPKESDSDKSVSASNQSSHEMSTHADSAEDDLGSILAGRRKELLEPLDKSASTLRALEDKLTQLEHALESVRRDWSTFRVKQVRMNRLLFGTTDSLSEQQTEQPKASSSILQLPDGPLLRPKPTPTTTDKATGSPLRRFSPYLDPPNRLASPGRLVAPLSKEIDDRIKTLSQQLALARTTINRQKDDVNRLRTRLTGEFDAAYQTLANLEIAVREEYESAFAEYKTLAAQRLELTLACSFGFWATVGLLIGWSKCPESGRSRRTDVVL